MFRSQEKKESSEIHFIYLVAWRGVASVEMKSRVRVLPMCNIIFVLPMLTQNNCRQELHPDSKCPRGLHRHPNPVPDTAINNHMCVTIIGMNQAILCLRHQTCF
jgi:hypothetical protein